MTPATDWKELVPPGEAQHLERLAERLRAMQRQHAENGKPHRALHAKGIVGVQAELETAADVPPHARVGIFAAPKKYPAYVRFSNGSGTVQPDRKPDVRGMAVKVLGVPGKKLIPGLESATTQDFLAIRSPATPFRTAEDFVWFVEAAQHQALLLPRAIGRFGPLGAIRLIRKLLAGISDPIPSVATAGFYSALAIRFGPHAAHYAFLPQTKGSGGKTPASLRDELVARLAREPIAYDLCAQFYVDPAQTPIEDPTVEWKTEWVRLGQLTLPRQDPKPALTELVERLSFDPWHAPEEFRPLGELMRARNAAYRLSTQERKAAPEPDGSETF